MAEYSSGVNLSIDILDYIALIVGGLFTYYGYINGGEFLAYLLYIKLFTQPIKKLVSILWSNTKME